MSVLGVYLRLDEKSFIENPEQAVELEKKVVAGLVLDVLKEPEVELQYFIDSTKGVWTEALQLRPAFKSLKGEIKGNRIQVVVVKNLVTLSRNPLELLLFLKLVREKNIKLIYFSTDGKAKWFFDDALDSDSALFALADYATEVQRLTVAGGMKRAAQDKRRICVSCGIAHTGQHLAKCMCYRCRKKKEKIIEKLSIGRRYPVTL